MSNMPNAIADLMQEQELEKSFVQTDPAFNLTEQQVVEAQQETQNPAATVNAVPQFKVKPVVRTAAQFVTDAQKTDAALFENMSKQRLDVSKVAQVLSKTSVPLKADQVLDYSKLTEEDIYKDSVPIEVKPFGSEDSLKIDLKDKNYAARWVNKNPILLGKALGNGFTYITKQDLAKDLDVAIIEDVHGHYINNDVIAMKCPKSKYFAALKASFLRAVNTVSNLSSQKAARNQALKVMTEQTGGGFAEEAAAGKVDFYTPGIEI